MATAVERMDMEEADDKNMRHKLISKRAATGEPVKKDQQRNLGIVHAVFGVLCLISAVVGFIVVGASPAKSTLRLLTATDYRNNATHLDTDFYPEVTFDLSHGTIDLGLVAAAISAGAAFGHLIGWVWRHSQFRQMEGGSNPYLWTSFVLWHPIVFLLVASLSGITNVFLMAFICLAVLAWLFLLWNADNLNSFSYHYAQHKAGVAGWSWLNVGFVFVVALATYIMIAIYAFKTFASDAFSLNGISSGFYIALVVIHLVLYLVNPLLFVAWKFGWIPSMYVREMIYYIFNGIFAIVATWLTIGLFIGDSVTIVP